MALRRFADRLTVGRIPQSHHAVGAAGGEDPAVPAERSDKVLAVVGVDRRGPGLPGRHIPEPEGIVEITDRQHRTVGAERRHKHVGAEFVVKTGKPRALAHGAQERTAGRDRVMQSATFHRQQHREVELAG
jgi:hypothetical protein